MIILSLICTPEIFIMLKQRHLYPKTPDKYADAAASQPPGYSNKVQYWAVGTNCCSGRGDFSCGAAFD